MTHRLARPFAAESDEYEQRPARDGGRNARCSFDKRARHRPGAHARLGRQIGVYADAQHVPAALGVRAFNDATGSPTRVARISNAVAVETSPARCALQTVRITRRPWLPTTTVAPWHPTERWAARSPRWPPRPIWPRTES